MDMIDGIIVGAAAAAIGTIVAMRFLNKQPEGGSRGNQPAIGGNANFGRPRPLYVAGGDPQDANAAPLKQNVPITEAAYNVQPVDFEHAFGPHVNQPAEEAVLPA